MKLIAILLSFTLSILMLAALADNPYSYYQFLRVATLLLSGFIIYVIYQLTNKNAYIWYFVAIAVLFNPLLPIYLDRSTWNVIDLLVALSAPIITVLALQNKKRNRRA